MKTTTEMTEVLTNGVLILRSECEICDAIDSWPYHNNVHTVIIIRVINNVLFKRFLETITISSSKESAQKHRFDTLEIFGFGGLIIEQNNGDNKDNNERSGITAVSNLIRQGHPRFKLNITKTVVDPSIGQSGIHNCFITEVTSALHNHTTLMSLQLKRYVFTDLASLYLSVYLESEASRGLIVLNLSETQPGSNLARILNTLIEHPSLRTLLLRNIQGGIPDDKITAIIASNRILKECDLNGSKMINENNSINPECWKKSSLEVLDLNRAISSRYFLTILSSLMNNNTLTELSLSSYDRSPVDESFVFACIQTLSKLQRLIIQGGELFALPSLLFHCRELSHLSFSTNDCTSIYETQGNILSSVLRSKTALQSLSVVGFSSLQPSAKQTSDVFKMMEETLEQNRSLMGLYINISNPVSGVEGNLIDLQEANRIREQLHRNKIIQQRVRFHWQRMSLLLAFVRSNVTSSLKTSVLALLNTLSMLLEETLVPAAINFHGSSSNSSSSTMPTLETDVPMVEVAAAARVSSSSSSSSNSRTLSLKRSLEDQFMDTLFFQSHLDFEPELHSLSSSSSSLSPGVLMKRKRKGVDSSNFNIIRDIHIMRATTYLISFQIAQTTHKLTETQKNWFVLNFELPSSLNSSSSVAVWRFSFFINCIETRRRRKTDHNRTSFQNDERLIFISEGRVVNESVLTLSKFPRNLAPEVISLRCLNNPYMRGLSSALSFYRSKFPHCEIVKGTQYRIYITFQDGLTVSRLREQGWNFTASILTARKFRNTEVTTLQQKIDLDIGGTSGIEPNRTSDDGHDNCFLPHPVPLIFSNPVSIGTEINTSTNTSTNSSTTSNSTSTTSAAAAYRGS